jgi:hypothetical protein
VSLDIGFLTSLRLFLRAAALHLIQLLSIFIADSTKTLFNLFIPFHKPAPSESGIILNGGGGAAQLFIPISRGGDGAKKYCEY